jgi:hypothetical protein
MNILKIATLSVIILFTFNILMSYPPVSAAGLQNINENLQATAQGAGVAGQSNLTLVIAAIINVAMGILGLIFLDDCHG